MILGLGVLKLWISAHLVTYITFLNVKSNMWQSRVEIITLYFSIASLRSKYHIIELLLRAVTPAQLMRPWYWPKRILRSG